MAKSGSLGTPPAVDQKTIYEALTAIVEPGQVVELRALDYTRPGSRYKNTASGYFNDLAKMAEQAARLSPHCTGVYFTPNPVNPALLARAENRVKERPDATTSDADILQRHWLLIDCDPERPRGISACEEEHTAALAVAEQMKKTLADEGWPEPVMADSGNGGHLMYRVDLPADDGGLCERVLKALAARFRSLMANDEFVEVDNAVHNPARIWKLYGTVARKGENMPDRPHRLARILSKPETLQAVPYELLVMVADNSNQEVDAKAGSAYSSKDGFDLPGWVQKYLPGAREEAWSHGKLWVVPVCPFNPEHNRGEAFVIQRPDGKIGAGCHHNSCAWNWRELREKFEPGCYTTKKRSRRAAQSGVASDTAGNYPEVVVNNRQLREIGDEALALLESANVPPTLFVRSGSLCRVVEDERGHPVIEKVTMDSIRSRLAKTADFISIQKKGESNVPPPLELCSYILAEGHWPFPPLEAITRSPTIRHDGTIASSPGYDPATALYYHRSGVHETADVPEHPTREDVQESVGLIDELLRDFPFDSQASKANAIALLLSPVVQPAIDGCTPLFLIDAPVMGSGKSLLAIVAGIISTGALPDFTTAPFKDEEWPKKITSLLATGSSFIVFDNLKYTLSNAELSAVLTTRSWKDRVFGKNTQTITLPNRATWVATGNNIQLGGDMPRRCVWIRIDPTVAKPHERMGFLHPNLPEWVQQNRGRLLGALLTLCRAWFADGRVEYPTPSFGSFEAWVRTVGCILNHVGIDAFLDNRELLWDQVDTETQPWADFLEAWYEQIGDEPVTVKELLKLVEKVIDDADNELPNPLRDALPPDLADVVESKKGDKYSKFGKQLRSRLGRRYGPRNLRLERAKPNNQGNRWKVLAPDSVESLAKPSTEKQVIHAQNAALVEDVEGVHYFTRDEKSGSCKDNKEKIQSTNDSENPPRPPHPPQPSVNQSPNPSLVPPTPCRTCGSTRHWRLTWNTMAWSCGECFPPPYPDSQIVWSDTGASDTHADD
ncbi:MAG: hypothetical protein HYX78_06570 [Armatimonadetes bacterium]|nr:hypothetical protein [Armatimonadota bacterium]